VREIPYSTDRRKGNKKKITVRKATGNNLKDVTVDFRLVNLSALQVCRGR
jgi:excinuclease ABC subunit A